MQYPRLKDDVWMVSHKLDEVLHRLDNLEESADRDRMSARLGMMAASWKPASWSRPRGRQLRTPSESGSEEGSESSGSDTDSDLSVPSLIGGPAPSLPNWIGLYTPTPTNSPGGILYNNCMRGGELFNYSGVGVDISISGYVKVDIYQQISNNSPNTPAVVSIDVYDTKRAPSPPETHRFIHTIEPNSSITTSSGRLIEGPGCFRPYFKVIKGNSSMVSFSNGAILFTEICPEDVSYNWHTSAFNKKDSETQSRKRHFITPLPDVADHSDSTRGIEHMKVLRISVRAPPWHIPIKGDAMLCTFPSGAQRHLFSEDALSAFCAGMIKSIERVKLEDNSKHPSPYRDYYSIDHKVDVVGNLIPYHTDSPCEKKPSADSHAEIFTKPL